MAKVNFDGVTPGRSFAVLEPGPHESVIAGFSWREDGQRVRVTLRDPKGRVHGDGFTIPKGLPFLMAFLVSAGIPQKKLKGDVDIDALLTKLVRKGAKVYFDYTPPKSGPNGERLKNAYPNYSYMTKDEYESVKGAVSDSEDEEDDQDVGPTIEVEDDSSGDEDDDNLDGFLE